MGRMARLVPGFPHRVTQRASQRQPVFFCDDCSTYLVVLRDYSRRCGLQVLAWCLISNHVHVVVIPRRKDSLARRVPVAKSAPAEFGSRVGCPRNKAMASPPSHPGRRKICGKR